MNGAFLLPLMPLTKLDLVKEDEFFITSGKTLLLSIVARADCCEILLFV